MAEDAVKLCKRGHPRTPENVGADRRCLECFRVRNREANVRYRKTAKGRAAQARYEATTKAWARYRKRDLKRTREAIAAKLKALKREEEECLKLVSGQRATK